MKKFILVSLTFLFNFVVYPTRFSETIRQFNVDMCAIELELIARWLGVAEQLTLQLQNDYVTAKQVDDPLLCTINIAKAEYLRNRLMTIIQSNRIKHFTDMNVYADLLIRLEEFDYQVETAKLKATFF